ncbi:MAG: hypothetical protein ACJAU5_000824, partial [Maricaulis maris]
MKTSKMMLMMMLASVTALGACAGHTSQPSPPPGPRPIINRPPPVAPDTVTPAINMCMVETLAEQRLEMLSEVHGYREAIRADALAGANVAD